MEGCGIRDELIAEAVEALVCKTSLSGFESHRYLHFSLVGRIIGPSPRVFPI